MGARIQIDASLITSFCRKWRIAEMALFGSVLRDDFGPESDVDVLVTFEADARWSLLDQIRMEDELGEVLGSKVEIVTRRSVERSENWIIRRSILDDAEVIYAA